MNARLAALLRLLADTLDPAREQEIADRHRAALAYEPLERLPLVVSYPLPADSPWQPYPHHEIFDDPEKMLFNELVSAWDTSIVHRPLVGDDLPATIRANFGTVLVASAFGAHIEQVEDNPPWVRSFRSREELAAGLARGPVDLTAGWLPRVVERYRFYRDVLAQFPPLPDVIRLALPDLQGPVDTLEMLCGSALYADLIEDPAFVAHALDKVAVAQVNLARQLAPLLNDGPAGFAHQHGFMIRGSLLLRGDSAIMVSPRMYRQQIAPHDERVLREMGGGGIHSCGNFMHNVGAMLELPSLQCLDFGQSPLNGVDAIYARARPRRIALVRVQVTAEELCRGDIRRRFPTGVTLLHAAPSFAAARDSVAAYVRYAVSQ
jgi:hypothetical protein